MQTSYIKRKVVTMSIEPELLDAMSKCIAFSSNSQFVNVAIHHLLDSSNINACINNFMRDKAEWMKTRGLKRSQEKQRIIQSDCSN